VATRSKQRNLGRLSEIAQVAVRHGFGYVVDGHRHGDPAADANPSPRGRHLREMLDELGPTFVKFGQLLSTRPDVVPPDIIAELRGLQDDVHRMFRATSHAARARGLNDRKAAQDVECL